MNVNTGKTPVPGQNLPLLQKTGLWSSGIAGAGPDSFTGPVNDPDKQIMFDCKFLCKKCAFYYTVSGVIILILIAGTGLSPPNISEIRY
ncbi:MAG: hypothetical protein DRH32_01900 [Deltaproteobacteria bacterium]|nr:MAG: hypothetical protein DRH32_01900 [Deltaproteobacteria bacterium]